jgi:hypothetical protein
MKPLFLAIALGLALSSSAQIAYLQDPVSATVFNTERYSEIKGSPYLLNKWLNGTATTDKGVYNKLTLKLDVYNNTLVFNKDDQPYEFQEDIRSFTLIPSYKDTMYFRKGIAGGGLKPEQYVQILAEGAKASAYRSDIKLVSEMSEVNRGMVKTFNSSVRYFIVKNNSPVLVKLNKKEVLAVLNDQEAKLSAFMEENKISLKREAELAKVVAYYNTL